METTNAVPLMREILRTCFQGLLEAEFLALNVPHLRPNWREKSLTQCSRYYKPVLTTQVGEFFYPY